MSGSQYKKTYENNNKYDEEFCYFLVKRIGRNGGSVQFQHLTGHLSGLSPEVRNAVGTTMPELKSFLKKHNDIFNVHGDMVSLSKPSVTEEKDDSDTDSIESKISLPEKIDGTGVIVKLCSEYGFIKTKEPIKTSVFFRPLHMGYNKDTNLMECGINIGTMVSFHARKERNQQLFTSKYCAIKVWKNKTIDEESIQKPRKKPETGLYDPLKLEGEGIIQKVFPNLGFIAVDGNENNTVFFHKNRLVNYENIIDLTKFLSRGDVMEFCAHRSTKPDVKARWEATKVWKKSGKSISSKRPENTVCQSNGIQTRLIMSSSDSGLGENDSQSALNVKHQNAKNEIIRNQKGKICPRSHGAVIKFGDDLSKLADGDSSIYFNYGAKVLDVGWEFDEGDDVLFDAVKIKSAPYWKATLVWVGEKPDTDDSTFNRKFSELTDEEIEIPDENYSSVSCNFYPTSSNSSVKSETTTSKSSNYNKAKTDCFIDNEVKNSNKKSSLYSSSQSSSQNSLSSFVDAKVFQKSRRELREKSSTREHNSRDGKKESKEISMYVDDNTSSSKENISDIVSSGHNQSSLVGSQDDDDNDLKTALDYLKTKDIDASLEGDNVKKMSKNTELNSENKHNSKRKGSIKKNQNVLGKILQVYSTFAKVESSELLKPIGFFSNVFYYNRKSAEELELSNLKEVLKVGDIVYFNYFEVVDDSGQNWCKVTMAWIGAKPIGVAELTPEDFIKQNDLPFTIKPETASYKETEEFPSKKFLTSFEDITPDCEAAECASLTESCMDNDETLQPINLKLEKSELQAEKSEIEASLNDDLEELPSRISEILRNKELFMTDLQVDLNILATDIINLVLEDCALKRSRQNSLKVFLPSEMRSEKPNSDVVCSACGKNVTEKLYNQNSDVTDVEVQTIITGDVMAQNIFTDC